VKTSRHLPMILLLFLALAGCQGESHQSDATAQAPITIQAYQPDPAVARDLLAAIHVATAADPRIAADATPNGTIIVAAPEEVQSDVRDLLQRLQETAPANPLSVAVDYWIVEAVPNDSDDAPSTGMDAIRVALETIQQRSGKQRFRLMEHLAVVASGPLAQSRLEGKDTQIQQSLKWQGNDIVLFPNIVHWDGPKQKHPDGTSSRTQNVKLKTRLVAPPDKLLVIGQSGGTDGNGQAVTLYYIVRAHLL